MHAPDDVLAEVRVARGRASLRALLRLGCATILIILIVHKYNQLDFRPSAYSNRIADYGWACILLVAAAVALFLTVTGGRWLLLAAWPARVAVVGTRRALELHLGPMGRLSYDVPRLTVRYLFEAPDQSEPMLYESLLDEREQVAKFLPQITHPASSARLDLLILKFAAAAEPDVAACLRPFIDHCRTVSPPPPAAVYDSDAEQPAAAVDTRGSSSPVTEPSFKIPRSYRDRIERQRGAKPENPPQPPVPPAGA